MKKKITAFLVTALMFVTLCIPAYAAETTPVTDEVTESDITPRGSLSGYGQKWHDPATDGTDGEFTFYVQGMNWPVGHLSVKLQIFNPSTELKIEVYRGGSQCIFRRQDVTINDGPWEDISFNPATTGAYTVKYWITGGPNSPGRVNCWIF